MRLYLVQHGQAKSKDEDPDRHLTDTGTLEVEKMATFLKPLEIMVEALWHSGKARAAQTAEILATGVTAKQGPVRHDGLAPKDDVVAIAEEISRLKKDIFIVGHLPFLSKLASLLLCDDASNEVIGFQYSGVVCLEQNEDKTWVLHWMVTPDLL
jgi:phosphohistidine phosphatase